MERRTFRVGDDPAAVSGAVLCRDVSVPSNGRPVTIRRGVPLLDALERLPANTDSVMLHILVPAADEVPQAEASAMLARALVGPGATANEPHQGQSNIVADTTGLLRVDASTIARLNRSPIALIATGLDGRVVEPGDTVAIVKASELLVDRAAIEEALQAVGRGPALRVAPFVAQRVGMLAGPRVGEANLRVSAKHLAGTLQRFGADLTAVEQIGDDPDEIAGQYRALLDAGTELVLVAGSIVLDPEDPFLVAMERIGARVERRGAPIDPGTMFWVGYAGQVPFFGLASCEMYGRLSIFDLLLPYAVSRETISHRLLAELGYGGLLSQTQSARRPEDWGEREADG